MSIQSFDRIEDATTAEQRSPQGSGALRPLFTVDLANDDEVHKWCKQTRDYAVRYARHRNNNVRLNFELYSAKRGTIWPDNGSLSGSRLEISGPQDYGYPLAEGVIVNHLYDLTENRVSKYVEYRPVVDVAPVHPTQLSDRYAAKANKEYLEYIRDTYNLDDINADMARTRIIAGEAYLFVEWNPDKGYVQPEVQQILNAGEVPVLENSSGEQPAESLANYRVGEVDFRVPDTRNIFLEPVISGKYEDVRYLFERVLRDVDELRAEYPQYAHKLEASTEKATPFLYTDGTGHSTDLQTGDLWFSEILPAANCIELWRLVHKPSKFLPEGREVLFTDSCVLSNGPDAYHDPADPYENTGFPIRVTDIDAKGDLYGVSVYIQTRNLNEFINKLYTMTYKNQRLTAYPKWMIPENCRVNKDLLGNDSTLVTFSGDKAPELATFPNTPKEVFALIQSMEQNLVKLFGVFPLSQGEVPPGMEAGIALRYLSEQEKARQNTQTIKQNNFIKQLYEKTLAVARRFYSPEDGRLIKIWGRDQSFQPKPLNPLHLSTPCEIRIQPSSVITESKAAKTQYMLDLDQRKPVPDEIFYECIELGIPEAFTNEVSYAKKAADTEEEMFFSGQLVQPPIEEEDLLTHWQRHYIGFQSPAYQTLSPELRAPKIDHMAATEQLLMAKAFIDSNMAIPANQALAQILLSNPNFPVFFKPNRDLLNAQAQMLAANPLGLPPTEESATQSPSEAK